MEVFDDIETTFDVSNNTNNEKNPDDSFDNAEVEIYDKKQDETNSTDDIYEEDLRTQREYSLPPYTTLLDEVKTHTDVYYYPGEEILLFLKSYGITGSVIDIIIGPRYIRYLIKPDPKINLRLFKDIDMQAVMQFNRHIHIFAPLPETPYCAIDIEIEEPNRVSLKNVINSDKQEYDRDPFNLPIGVTVEGNPFFINLKELGNTLIAGSTGSGKTKLNDAIICSILLKLKPDEVKLLLIDTSRIEYIPYNNIPHLIAPIATNVVSAANTLESLIRIIDERYNSFSAVGVKDIESYNQVVELNNALINGSGIVLKKLSYIIVMIDNLETFIIVNGIVGESLLRRLLELCNAAGIICIMNCEHLSDTRFIENISHALSTRISFVTSNARNSEINLGIPGAEKLLGNGEFLLRKLEGNNVHKVQGAYVSDKEISKITEDVKKRGKPEYDDHFIRLYGVEDNNGIMTVDDDPMFEEAKEYVIQAQKASTSLLQRRFGIGYNRAARMIDYLEESGIIGPAQGSKPREVFVKYNEK